VYLGSNRYAYVRCNEIQELPAGMDKDWHPDRQNRLMNMIYVALSFGLFASYRRHTIHAFSYDVQCAWEWIRRERYTLLFLGFSSKCFFLWTRILLHYLAGPLRQVIHILQAKCTNPLQGMLMNAKVNEESSTLRFTRIKYF
jgi:hypothetical protein